MSDWFVGEPRVVASRYVDAINISRDATGSVTGFGEGWVRPAFQPGEYAAAPVAYVERALAGRPGFGPFEAVRAWALGDRRWL